MASFTNRIGGGGIHLDFEGVIRKWVKNTDGLMGEAHRRASVRLFSDIINSTPVDTGEAAGGWVIQSGRVRIGSVGTLGRGASLARLGAVKADFSKVVFMSNAVGHVAGLEYGTHWYGFSPKAPAGMVRINVANFPRIMREEIARLKK